MSDRSFTVRRAAVPDIPSLCALEIECFSQPWSEKSFEDFFTVEYSVAYAAELDGKIVGYVGMYLSFGDGEITNIAVTHECRRMGIATALIDALRHTDGVERLLLEVRVSNEGARRLYSGYGFKEDGIRRGFYSNPREDAVLMSLSLI
ncbi:MAG: ribosomal protein S18-alanine N-acetyltransferase [Clostridiales bacterium]|nr:ribosomal protein S18-alanine N-acetyltransferase [Clostridiales bacterium]